MPNQFVDLQAVYELPSAVFFSLRDLGGSFWGHIGGHRTRLLLPVQRQQSDGELADWLGPPALSGIGAQWRLASIGELDWGHVSSRDVLTGDGYGQVGALGLRTRVTRAAGETRLDAARRAHGALSAEVDRWFRKLADWVEVFSGQDLGPDQPSSASIAPNGWIMTDGTPERLQGVITVNVRVPPADLLLTLPQVQHLSDLVSHGTDPPVEHVLLSRARRALRRGDYRKAVLDCGTVTEVALFALIRDSHRSQVSDLGSFLFNEIESRATLGRLLHIARKVCPGQVPASITDQVITVRNKTTHRVAYQPSNGEALAALIAATDLMKEASPLPAL